METVVQIIEEQGKYREWLWTRKVGKKLRQVLLRQAAEDTAHYKYCIRMVPKYSIVSSVKKKLRKCKQSCHYDT
jgi:hypothetical protein